MYALLHSLNLIDNELLDSYYLTMPGFLLIAPTGSGKSWVCANDTFFVNHAIDGDPLIDWPRDWSNIDWTVQDRKHLNIVLSQMRKSRKCVCWYVGTSAIADALADGRLSANEVGIVLLPQQQHRSLVENRDKQRHDWTCAIKHLTLCENLIRTYQLAHFVSFQDSIEHVRSRLNFAL